MKRDLMWRAAAVCAAALEAGSMAWAQGDVPAAPEPEAEVAAESEARIDVGLFSAYVWRGAIVNDEAVMQPSISWAAGPWGFVAWGSIDLTDRLSADQRGEFSEVDLSASYTRQLGAFEIEGGLIEYLFPHVQDMTDEGPTAAQGTREVYVSAGADFELPFLPEGFTVSPLLELFYDIDEADGFYGSLSLSHARSFLQDQLECDATVSAGFADSAYNAYYFGASDAAFVDGTASLTATYSLTDDLSFSAGVQYMRLLDSSLRDAVGADGDPVTDDESVTGNLTVAYKF